jgi:hypothetical protein
MHKNYKSKEKIQKLIKTHNSNPYFYIKNSHIYYILHHTKKNSINLKQKFTSKTTIMYYTYKKIIYFLELKIDENNSNIKYILM